MYICQDKCYRSVPKKDHRYAQFDDYVEKSFFCGICCVVIRLGSQAYGQMLVDHMVTGLWTCPCCKARPRSYFDIDAKRNEFFLKTLQKSKHFKKIVDEFFRVRKEVRDDAIRFKELEDRLAELAGAPSPEEPQMAPPQQAKITQFTDYSPKENRVQRAREISLFPR